MNISADQKETPLRLEMRINVALGERAPACELIALKSGLSKSRIKDAMNKGAVWLSAKKGGRKRLRKASARTEPGDVLELFYDAGLLAIKPPLPRCLYDAVHYSVWHKPAGLLAQGTDYGDHCSLVRQVELYYRLKRLVLPVHRLDREVAGLMLLPHSRIAAARFSEMFRGQAIDKRYLVTVLGCLAEEGLIELPLDGRPAATNYLCTGYDEVSGTSTAEVRIITGRLHQIRRHFAMLGHPLLGDPRYGKGNKNRSGLELVAHHLAFRCPFTGRELVVSMGKPPDES